MNDRRADRQRIDFHSHTYLTDGEASAMDMWTAADRLEHRALAITDHIGLEDPRPLLTRLAAEAEAFRDGPMVPVIGVEVSMVPPRHIAEVARRARAAGAQIVIVHGETLAEPVREGTNRAAIECGEVDLLAHPGLLSLADAELAAAQGVFLELSARNGHSLTNGHVARVAGAAHASVVVDSDAHRTQQLLPLELARSIASGAGLSAERIGEALSKAPRALLKKVGVRL